MLVWLRPGRERSGLIHSNPKPHCKHSRGLPGFCPALRWYTAVGAIEAALPSSSQIRMQVLSCVDSVCCSTGSVHMNIGFGISVK